RDMGKLLHRPLGDAAPAVSMARGKEAEPVMLIAEVEPECRIKLFRLGQVRHGDVEPVDRMYPDLALTAFRFDKPGDLGHQVTPVRYVARRHSARTPNPNASRRRTLSCEPAGSNRSKYT